MIRRLIALILWPGLFAGAKVPTQLTPETARHGSPLRPVYQIDARLEGRSILGELSLRIENGTQRRIPILVLHLYPNAFRGGSVFHAESRRPAVFEDPRRTFPRPEDEGKIEILRLLVDGAPVFGRHEGTQLVLPLVDPLEPGERLELNCRFETRLPRFDWRSGQMDGLSFVGQWYPQLAAFNAADGRFRRAEYHRFGEFDSDFADYEVTLQLPASLTPGTSGTASGGNHEESVSSEVGASWVTHRFSASGVSDFAWVAGEYRGKAEARTASGVLVRALCTRPEDAERVLALGLRSLSDLEGLFGSYPFPTLTLAETPVEGGMEYPRLVFLGAGILRTGGETEVEVITHEIAHQWFPLLVASDTLSEAWIDEGMATYATARVLDMRYGTDKRGLRAPGFLRRLWPDLSYEERVHVEALLGDGIAPERPVSGADPPWLDPAGYVTTVYSRAARVLFALEADLGRKRFDAWLRGLIRRRRFSHLTTAELVRSAVEAGAAAELEDWLIEPGTCSIEIAGVSTRRSTLGYETTVTLRDRGGHRPPTPVRVSLEDGTVLERMWPAGSREGRLVMSHGARLIGVELDPEKTIPEGERHDNTWPRRLRFVPLGGLPLNDVLVAGLTPVFGGQSRDELLLGLQFSLSTPWTLAGPYGGFTRHARFRLESAALFRPESRRLEGLLGVTARTGEREAVQARFEVRERGVLLEGRWSVLRARSGLVGPFWLGAAGVQWNHGQGRDFLTARISVRRDAVVSLLHPRGGTAVQGWFEGTSDFRDERFGGRGLLQVGGFFPVGRFGLGYAASALGAARDHPLALSAEEHAWLTAWPGERADRLATARLEIGLQPLAPVVVGLGATGGWLGADARAQAGPVVHFLGELPFALHLELPFWTTGAGDDGIAWRWAIRVGPRLGEL